MSQIPPDALKGLPLVGKPPRMEDMNIATPAGVKACPPACVVGFDTNLLDYICRSVAQYVIAAYIELTKQQASDGVQKVDQTTADTPASAPQEIDHK